MVQRTVNFQLLLGVAFFGVLTALGYILFVLTTPGQEYDYTAFAGHQDVFAGVVRINSMLMKMVNGYTLAGGCLGILLIARLRKRLVLGGMALAGIAVALAGTELMKAHLPRPELIVPNEPLASFLAHESYPSGHTTFPTIIALGFVLVSAPRWRPWVASVAGFLASLYGITVVFVGAHRPADPMGAIFWSTFCMALAAWVALRLRGQTRMPGPHFPALALGAALCLFIALATLFCAKGLPPTFLPLLVMVLLIVSTAFAATAWFGRVLSGESAPAASTPPA